MSIVVGQAGGIEITLHSSSRVMSLAESSMGGASPRPPPPIHCLSRSSNSLLRITSLAIFADRTSKKTRGMIPSLRWRRGSRFIPLIISWAAEERRGVIWSVVIVLWVTAPASASTTADSKKGTVTFKDMFSS